MDDNWQTQFAIVYELDNYEKLAEWLTSILDEMIEEEKRLEK